ncbi:hypothetical protein YDYSY3_08420 [Paenibacillus chitinolyticus]|nr:hypothetical protein YDYSY3_08420 [Paenibacillus chitinolyticus]
MEPRKPLDDLATEVVKELERLNYAYNTVCGLRASFKRICAFARDRNVSYFSENLSKEYLEEKYSCTTDYYLEAFPKRRKKPFAQSGFSSITNSMR